MLSSMPPPQVYGAICLLPVVTLHSTEEPQLEVRINLRFLKAMAIVLKQSPL